MRKLQLALKIALVLFVVLELGLRVTFTSHPRLWCADPVLGHVLRPGASGWWEEEGDGFVQVNANGMRDKVHPVERKPGRVRIAVLGDGMTEADQVMQTETWPSLLETALTQRPELVSRGVEVLNFGVNGYSTGQELLLFRQRVKAFKPDIVLVCFDASNDVPGNSAALGGAGARPYFRRDGQAVVEDERFRASMSQWAIAVPFFALVDVLADWSRVVQEVAWIAARFGESRAPADPSGLTSADRAYAPSPDDNWREAWMITERLFITLRDDCKDAGAKLMVVCATYGPQVDPDPKVREGLAQKLGVADLLYPETRLAPFLVGNRVPFYPLAPVFQRQATAQNVQYHGFERHGTPGRGHWNKDGHALAAKLIVPWLLQHLQD